jgi:hypothetical protein
VASDNHPEKVFVFFRTDEITNPMKHTSGRAESVLNGLKNQNEPTFDSIVDRDRSLDQILSTEMRGIYSIQERRPSALAALERSAASLIHPGVIIHTARRAMSIVGLGELTARNTEPRSTNSTI